MTSWTLTHFSDLTGAYGVAGYGVLDALGVRLGHVSGWVARPSGAVALLEVTVRDWFKSRDYLLPLGSISLIDDDRRHLHLRQLTRRMLTTHCLPAAPELPPASILEESIRFFPNPRPSVVERLADPSRHPECPSPGRLTLVPEQGDGAHRRAAPLLQPTPHWTKLGRLAPPAWTPLSSFLREWEARR